MTAENTRAVTPAPGSGQSPLRSKLFWVALLYFSEGFPLGLFFDLFPVYFRQQGVDLASIGLLSLLGLAWTVKFLWAPAVDHYRHHRYWMAAVDCAMGVVMMVFAQYAGFNSWVWLAIGVFTLLSATNDIAIDGYTIELLNKEELGFANGVRIGFYRVGMLGAGVVLILTDYLGWNGAFICAAGLFLLSALACLTAPSEAKRTATGTNTSAAEELQFLFSQPAIALAVVLFVLGLLWPVSGALRSEMLNEWQRAWWFKAGIPVALFFCAAALIAKAAHIPNAKESLARGPVFGALIDLLSRPDIAPVLLFILVFKLGDASMGFMVKPFWVDSGFTNQQIGLVSVNIGLLLSIAGGLIGGWYTDRVGIFHALWVLGLWQAFSNLGYAYAAWTVPHAPQGTSIELTYQGIMYAASAMRSRKFWPRSTLRPPTSICGCPNCSAASRVSRASRPSPIRSPVCPRPGRRVRCSCCCRPVWA